MSFWPWLQSLVTFRKDGTNDLVVPQLDSLGRIRVSIDNTGGVFVSASPPTLLDGSVLWYNTLDANVYYYDLTRSKWLSTQVVSVSAGRNGTVGAGQFYRGVDGMALDASTRGLPIHGNHTIVSISATKTDVGNSTLEVLNNGVVVGSLAMSGAGVQSSSPNIDITSGLLSFRNALSSASSTDNVQLTIQCRRRST